MLAVFGIYGLGALLCLGAGAAVRGLLWPRDPWIGADTVPLGLAALIAILYPLGLALPGTTAGPVVVAMVVLGLAGALARRVRSEPRERVTEGARAALAPSTSAAIVVGGGLVLGALLLVATARQGFPTTIAVTNNDGWGYAGMAQWLTDHPFPRDVRPDIAHPMTLVPWNYSSHDFAVGFEHFAAMLAALLGRDGFEVVNAAAAVGLAAAVGGWAALASGLRSRLGPRDAALVLAAGATPVAALPFTENYVSQFVSICLWPFAVGAFVAFVRFPGWRRLVVAATASAAVVGVYPSLTPWLVLPLIVVAALAPPRPEWTGSRLARLAGVGPSARVLRGAALAAALVLAVAVVAPIQVARAVQNVMFLDALPVNAITGFFPADSYAALFLGSENAFSLFAGVPASWSVLAGLGLVAVAYLVALAPSGRPRDESTWILGVGLAVVLTTAVVLVRYRFVEELPYQVYKALISGGAVLAGVAVIGLLPRGGPASRGVRLVALGLLVAIWIPVTGRSLQASADGAPGFRSADVEMGRALARLPAGSTVLAAGAAPDERSFQFRMMAAYFGDHAPDRTVIGVGSTGTYLTPGALPEWRPARPWTHVLSTRPEPLAGDGGRERIWANSVYALDAAPALDLTTYGTGWYPTEDSERPVFAWTSARADVVVANRGTSPRAARLTMVVSSYGRPRALTLSAAERDLHVSLPAEAPTPVGIDLDLPAASTVLVTLDARPGAAPAPSGDPRTLMVRVQELRVTGRSPPSLAPLSPAAEAAGSRRSSGSAPPGW
jgi:hypothetical protein